MTTGWVKKDGSRFTTTEVQRIQRRFRHHVRTPSNPNGRIHRERCFWHPNEIAEAHHVDYSKPFVVAWAGNLCGCHRRIEHGTLAIPKKAIFDYTSLVEWRGVQHLRKSGPVLNSRACTCGRKHPREPHGSACPKFHERVAVPF